MRVGLCVLCVLAVAAASPATPDRKYTAKYDNVDVDRILSNERILTNYIKCMMDEGSCTNEGRELKKTLPDALSTGCSKCNEKQKTVSEKVITFLMSNRKKDWDRLTKKYDPKGEFQKRYDEAVKNGTITKPVALKEATKPPTPKEAPKPKSP